MSGTWDASIISTYAVRDGESFAADTVRNGDAFDVVANVRIGRNLMQFVDRCELFVSVRNLSESNTFARQHHTYDLTPQKVALHQQFRVKIAEGWHASEGDAVEVITTFKVTSGINHDHTLARSEPFIVTA
jgi:hypothetical protein